MTSVSSDDVEPTRMELLMFPKSARRSCGQRPAVQQCYISQADVNSSALSQVSSQVFGVDGNGRKTEGDISLCVDGM